MLWPVEKRVRYAAIRERMTPVEGKRMRCIRGAKAAHEAMRAQGRTPGAEGRAMIERNRMTRKFAKGMEEQYRPSWRHRRTNMNGI